MDDTNTLRQAVTDDKDYWSERQAYKQVRLFLCTKDNKVGDIVYHLPDTNTGLKFKIIKFIDDVAIIEYFTHPDPLKAHLIGTQREWMKSNLFKVLGQVSPDSTWVTEYMTFTPQQVRLKKEGMFPGPDQYYEFLCSHCKHFH